MRTRPKASWLGLAGLLALVMAGAALVPRPVPGPGLRPLPEVIPPGPLLVLQARDFSSLVRDWNESPEKRWWLESSNYAAFSRSRLDLRLGEARSEFAAAAGVPPDMALLESVAGGDSVLALYDIGKLEFLYITRMPSARAVENALGRGRGNYEPREAAGLQYFVHVDKASQRVVAFATTDDALLLATREDLLGAALGLIAGQKGPAVADEMWFAGAVRAASRPSPPSKPDLRLVVNLATVMRSPYFRSYWIQRNATDLRQYRAAVSDLYRSPTEIREKRVLLRSNQGADSAAPAGDAAGGTGASEVAGQSVRESPLSEVLHLVPANVGLYRAWAAPRTEDALNLLEEKILSPSAGPPPVSKAAPAAPLDGGSVGSESDLETRIDEPPQPIVGARFVPMELIKLLESSRLEAALELESSETASDGVFVRTPSGVVLLAAADWDGERARRALTAAAEKLWTTADLGVAWIPHQRGQGTYYELDGLAGLSMATRGRLLVVANSPLQLVAVLDRIPKAPSENVETPGLVYAARFNHARESANFTRMMRLIDYPNSPSPPVGAPGDHEPQFFSENISSLSHTLSRVESASIAVDDHGPAVSVTVVYRLKK